MALVDCPDCNRRVSSRAEICAHCGAPIAGAGVDDFRATRHAGSSRSRARLKLQLLTALTLFVLGACWLIFENLDPGESNRLFPGLLTVGGLIWYAIVRLLLWVRSR
ncbi:zinc ribbon domain-containing protein [soil metagenome]